MPPFMSPPINDWFPCTYPHHMGGCTNPPLPPCVTGLLKTLFPMCCVVFNKTNVILSHLIASLFLQFEKFYVKFSVCFCLISVKVSEFIYLEIYLRKQ